ncbi:hypothetical protein U1E44_00470 [Arenibacter sp. GZD96]|uniref:hypothetical protein n=1 Tax=Aurantibrevibacter litoralis TaxID=3106030 RepID=UPI002AFE37A8|nr:hypothetical protein [Arenibacter sp. GZD-96]MEA1784552.1 hypothetical protein [Arenibacter sp. GZD-96]
MKDLLEKDFLRVINEYYPAFIQSGSSEYRKSVQCVRLNRVLKKALIENEITISLKYFLNGLIKENKNYTLHDYTLFEGGDRCYNIQLIKDFHEERKSHSLCINLSVLIPYYTIHILEVRRSENFKKRIGGPERMIHLEATIYNELISKVKNYLNVELGLYLFPENLINKVIPDISYENSDFGEFTFYNAFFLNSFYTR